MSTRLPVLSGVDLGREFHAMVDAIAEQVRPAGRGACVLLDDLPDTSARLDLVRLAVIVALERQSERFDVRPASGCYWNQVGYEWVVSRTEPAPPFTFVGGKPQPPERAVTLSDAGHGVRVSVNGTAIEVAPPSEQECARLLGSGVRGTAVRFPVFPSSGSSMIARGERPDELVLWRCGLPASRHRMPGPVIAAIHEADINIESLTALVEADGELVLHAEGYQTGLLDLRVPIDSGLADEAGHDLSPLYMNLGRKHWGRGFHFRRGQRWWTVRDHAGRVTFEQSDAGSYAPTAQPFHYSAIGDGVLRGRDHSNAARREAGWTAWGVGLDDVVIPVPPGEDVLSLTKLATTPALLTRDGDVIRARTPEGAHTVVEFAGPVLPHHGLPWVAVQRSPHLVEVVDVATGAVLHRLDTA